MLVVSGMQIFKNLLGNLSLFLFASSVGCADGASPANDAGMPAAKIEALRRACPQEAKGDLSAILRQMAPFVKLDDVEMVSTIAANCLPSVSGQGERLIGLTIKICVKRITEDLKLSLASQVSMLKRVEKCDQRFAVQNLEPDSREYRLANDRMWLCKLQIYASFYKERKPLVVVAPGEPKLVAMVEPQGYEEAPRFEAKYFFERVSNGKTRKCVAFSVDTADKKDGQNLAWTFTFDFDRYQDVTWSFGPKLELRDELNFLVYDYSAVDQYDSKIAHLFRRVVQVVDGKNFLPNRQYYAYFCYKEAAGTEYPTDLRLLNLSYQFTPQFNHKKYDDQSVVMFLIRNTKEEIELNEKLNHGH